MSLGKLDRRLGPGPPVGLWPRVDLPGAHGGSSTTSQDVTPAGPGPGYHREGTGPPLVLVHGGWEDRHAWDRVVSILATGFEVVAVDRPGHGGAPAGADELSALAGLLRSLDAFPAHLAAHGTGASVVVRLASEHPELARSVLLHEPPFYSLLPSERSARPLEELRACQQLARDGLAREAAERYLREFASERETWGALGPSDRDRWLRNAGLWAREVDPTSSAPPEPVLLDEIAAPVLVTVGADSPPVEHELAERAAARAPNGRLRDLPGAGHLPHLFDPATLAGVWAEFLLSWSAPVS